MFFYFHHDLPWIEEINDENKEKINVRGQTNELDGFNVNFLYNRAQHRPVVAKLTDVFELDKIHDQTLKKLNMKNNHYALVDQPFKDFEHNTFVFQITLLQPIPGQTFSLDIVFQSDSSESQRRQDLTGQRFNDEIARHQRQFDEKFENIFQLKSKFNFEPKKLLFARSTLSNLLGGLAYFTGKPRVERFHFLLNCWNNRFCNQR